MRNTYVLIVLGAALLLSACQSSPEASPAPVPPEGTKLASPTALPGPTETRVPPTLAPTETALPPTPTLPPAYETIAPHKIKAGDFTLDVSVELYTNQLRFNVNSTYPMSAEGAYPEGDMPQPMKNVELQVQGVPLTLKMIGGGGGGGTDDNGNAQRGQGMYYSLDPAFKKGEQIHVTALVTFTEYLGISEPVRFEYDLVVKDPPKR